MFGRKHTTDPRTALDVYVSFVLANMPDPYADRLVQTCAWLYAGTLCTKGAPMALTNTQFIAELDKQVRPEWVTQALARRAQDSPHLVAQDTANRVQARARDTMPSWLSEELERREAAL